MLGGCSGAFFPPCTWGEDVAFAEMWSHSRAGADPSFSCVLVWAGRASVPTQHPNRTQQLSPRRAPSPAPHLPHQSIQTERSIYPLTEHPSPDTASVLVPCARSHRSHRCQASTPCRAVPCCGVPCHAVPCRAVPCRAVLCHAVSPQTRSQPQHPPAPGPRAVGVSSPLFQVQQWVSPAPHSRDATHRGGDHGMCPGVGAGGFRAGTAQGSPWSGHRVSLELLAEAWGRAVPGLCLLSVRLCPDSPVSWFACIPSQFSCALHGL